MNSINEIFDLGNYYSYSLWKKELGKVYKDENFVVKYDNYLYKFTDKNDISYIVKLSYINDYPGEEYKKYLTLDYQDLENFQKNKKDYDLEYKNLNVNDAIKVLNTVMTILSDFLERIDVEFLTFTCTEDRYKTYLYIVKRHIPYIMVDFKYENKYVFQFYNPEYFDMSNNDTIVRKDSGIEVYSKSDEEI